MTRLRALLSQTRFAPFFWTQALGALNDNVFKTALVTLVAFHSHRLTTLDTGLLVTLLPGVFILPFFLFSATAGQLADKYEKTYLIRLVKQLEIGIMLLASIGFLFNSLAILAAALFLMGCHSALFGPVKYAYLPQHLQSHELTAANGLVEMGTFVAILLGQMLGAWLSSVSDYALITSLSVLLIALGGYASSLCIPHMAAVAPQLKVQWQPMAATLTTLRNARRQPALWVAILAISWFWFFGATLLTQLPSLVGQVLHGSEHDFIALLSVFSIGVGLGSLCCEVLSRGRHTLGLVMLGMTGMSVFGWDFAMVSASQPHLTSMVAANLPAVSSWPDWRLLFDLGLLGGCGGLYIVPLYVQLQSGADQECRAQIIAANNIMNALWMVLSAVCSAVLLGSGCTIPQLLAITTGMHLLMGVYLCYRQPLYKLSTIAYVRQLCNSRVER